MITRSTSTPTIMTKIVPAKTAAMKDSV